MPHVADPGFTFAFWGGAITGFLRAFPGAILIGFYFDRMERMGARRCARRNTFRPGGAVNTPDWWMFRSSAAGSGCATARLVCRQVLAGGMQLFLRGSCGMFRTVLNLLFQLYLVANELK